MKFFDKLFGIRKPKNQIPRTKRRFPKKAPKPQPVPNTKKIDYIINDPTTMKLVESMDAPEAPATPKYTVQHYAGGGFKRGTREALAANCYVTLTNVLNLYSDWGFKVNRWAGTSNLIVRPMAGPDLNAFYDRRSLQFFYFSHKRLGGAVFTAESSDIVAHELGHAILDTLRPDTWSAASLEIWSFHEAFADLTAFLNVMSYDKALRHALKQTGGDLRRPNVISNLAEQVGNAIYKFSPPTAKRNPICLRSAINNFKYIDPSKLPEDAPHNKLAAECHSFGRVFLGVYYDIMVSIYEKHVAEGMPPLKALKRSRMELGKRALHGVLHASLNVHFYESMAKTMLWVDKTKFGGTYQDVMRSVFVNRKLLPPVQLRTLSAPPCENEEGIVRTQNTLRIKLSDHIVSAQAQGNPLYDVELEIPNEQLYLYDNDKSLMDVVVVSNADVIAAAQDMVHYLHIADKVGDDKPFEVSDGKLVRTHFS